MAAAGREGVSGEGGLCVKFGHGVLSSSKRTIITNDPIRKKFPFATFSEKLEEYQLWQAEALNKYAARSITTLLMLAILTDKTLTRQNKSSKVWNF